MWGGGVVRARGGGDWGGRRGSPRRGLVPRPRNLKGFGGGHRCAEEFWPQSDSKRVAARCEGSPREGELAARRNGAGAARDRRQTFLECEGTICGNCERMRCKR